MSSYHSETGPGCDSLKFNTEHCEATKHTVPIHGPLTVDGLLTCSVSSITFGMCNTTELALYVIAVNIKSKATFTIRPCFQLYYIYHILLILGLPIHT